MRVRDLEIDCIKLPMYGFLRMSLCAPRNKCSTINTVFMATGCEFGFILPMLPPTHSDHLSVLGYARLHLRTSTHALSSAWDTLPHTYLASPKAFLPLALHQPLCLVFQWPGLHNKFSQTYSNALNLLQISQIIMLTYSVGQKFGDGLAGMACLGPMMSETSPEGLQGWGYHKAASLTCLVIGAGYGLGASVLLDISLSWSSFPTG